MLFELFANQVHDDVSSNTLQFLNLAEQVQFQLVHSTLYQTVRRVVPTHNFISILHAFENNQPLPPLLIPTNFKLDKNICEKISRHFNKNGMLPNWITKFLVLFHQHPFCFQLLCRFDCNDAFLRVYCQQDGIKNSSKLMSYFDKWSQLLQLIQSEKSETGECVVNEKWIQETDWICSVGSFTHIIPLKKLNLSLVIPNHLLEAIFDNRSLTLFLVENIHYLVTGTSLPEFITQLLSHLKWKQIYRKEIDFQLAIAKVWKAYQLPMSDTLADDLELSNITCENTAAQFVEANPRLFEYFEKWHFNFEFLKRIVNYFGNSTVLVECIMKRQKVFQIISTAMEKGESPVASLFHFDMNLIKFVYVYGGFQISFFPTDILDDRELILKSVTHNGYKYTFIKNDLANDREIVLAAAKSYPEIRVPNKEFETDQDLLALQLKNRNNEPYAKQLLNEKAFAFKAVQMDGSNLLYLSDDLRNDTDVVKAAIRQNSAAILCADKSFCSDRQKAKMILETNGFCWQYLSESLKQDQELLCTAIKQNGMVFENCKHLQQDEICKAAVEYY